MRRNLGMLRAVMRKEMRQTLRDKRMVAMLLFAPVLQVVVFGYAVDLDVDHVPTVVVDHDRSTLSRRHLEGVLADGTLERIAETPSEPEAERMLETGLAAAVLIVPEGFERDVVRGRPTTVQALLDGTNPNRSNVAAAAVSGYFARESMELVQVRLRMVAALQQSNGQPGVRTPGTVRAESRVLYNPRLETAIYMVPGVVAMLLMVITTIVTAMGLARERERGTLEQILVTPVRPWVLILGKILPFAGFGLFTFGFALAVGSWVFDMPIRGSIPLLFGATILYLLTTLGMGLLISTLSGSQQQAFMGGFLFMLPAALLSGIMTPVRSMPEWMQPLTLVNPVRHFAEVSRGVLLRGATASDVSMQLVALAISGALVFTFAVLRFRKTVG